VQYRETEKNKYILKIK